MSISSFLSDFKLKISLSYFRAAFAKFTISKTLLRFNVSKGTYKTNDVFKLYYFEGMENK